MAPPAPSLRENAPASSSARTSRNPSAPPKSVASSAFFLRLTPYPLRLWIGEFFRGSLDDLALVDERTGHIERSMNRQVNDCSQRGKPFGFARHAPRLQPRPFWMSLR